MVFCGYSSIRAETAELNVSKEGFTSLFVDQGVVNADDDNDGGSWTQPFLTIGGALTIAEEWTRIYVRSGIYRENLQLNKEHLELIGVAMDGVSKVEVSPATGYALAISRGACEASFMAFISTDEHAIIMRGLGVPGKSMYIENHGGGSGINRLYYQISEDGYRWSEVMSMRPGRFEGYNQDDGVRIWLLKVWASNANVSFTTRITPGIWIEDELLELGLLSPAIIETPTISTSTSDSADEPPATEVEITVPSDQIK